MHKHLLRLTDCAEKEFEVTQGRTEVFTSHSDNEYETGVQECAFPVLTPFPASLSVISFF